MMRAGDRRSRAIDPREVRVVFNTTLEVRQRLEEIAERNGWSLSKTAHLAMVEGLEAWGWGVDAYHDPDLEAYLERFKLED